MWYNLKAIFYIKGMIKLNTKGINIAKARKNANLTMEELGKVAEPWTVAPLSDFEIIIE